MKKIIIFITLFIFSINSLTILNAQDNNEQRARGLIGGQKITNTADNSNCTSSYYAKYDDVYYLVTAGHCGDNGDYFKTSNGSGIGYMEYSYSSPNNLIDYGLIQLDNQSNYEYGIQTGDGYKPVLGVVKNTGQVQCYNTYTYGAKSQKEIQLTYSGLTSDNTLRYMSEEPLQPGDSGAPVYIKDPIGGGVIIVGNLKGGSFGTYYVTPNYMFPQYEVLHLF